MKTKIEIDNFFDAIDEVGNEFPLLTYRDGVIEALMWVVEEAKEEEEFAMLLYLDDKQNG